MMSSFESFSQAVRRSIRKVSRISFFLLMLFSRFYKKVFYSPNPHICTGQIRIGQIRPGQIRPGQIRPGQIRPGQIRPGQIRIGQIRPVQIRPGQIRPGQIRPGQTLSLRNKGTNHVAERIILSFVHDFIGEPILDRDLHLNSPLVNPQFIFRCTNLHIGKSSAD